MMARRPLRIYIGGIDQVEAGVDKSVQQSKRCRFIGGPAEYIATQRQRRYLQFRSTQSELVHPDTLSFLRVRRPRIAIAQATCKKSAPAFYGPGRNRDMFAQMRGPV